MVQTMNTHYSFGEDETSGVLCLWSREQQAELSSVQSSLNSNNRICYSCNGRNKGGEAQMGMWLPGGG